MVQSNFVLLVIRVINRTDTRIFCVGDESGVYLFVYSAIRSGRIKNHIETQ